MSANCTVDPIGNHRGRHSKICRVGKAAGRDDICLKNNGTNSEIIKK